MADKVVVREQKKPLTYYTADGQTKKIGDVVSRVYEGENVMRHTFQNASSGLEYRLGVGSEVPAAFINLREPMKVMLDAGWEVKDLHLARGGIEHAITWENPNAEPLEDPILWDRDEWQFQVDRGLPTTLTEGIVQRGSIRPGHGINFQHGYFRLVCTNGLTGELFGSSVRVTPRNWDAASLAEDLFGAPVARSNDHVLGGIVGNRQGVRRFAETLNRLATDDDYVESLPRYVQEVVAPFSRVPQWYLSELQNQATVFVENGPQDAREIDISNMLTNAMNLHRFTPLAEGEDRQSRSLVRMHRNMNSLAAKSTALVGIHSL